jgi:hypothetical protein
MGLRRPLFDMGAEHAVKPTMRSISATKLMWSPGRLKGGSIVIVQDGYLLTGLHARHSEQLKHLAHYSSEQLGITGLPIFSSRVGLRAGHHSSFA